MAKDGIRKCPDCNGDSDDLAGVLGVKGDGDCRNCEGTGRVSTLAEGIISTLSFGTTDNDRPCEVCNGTKQCQTCGGEGYEYYYTPNDTDEHQQKTNWSELSSSNYHSKPEKKTWFGIIWDTLEEVAELIYELIRIILMLLFLWVCFSLIKSCF